MKKTETLGLLALVGLLCLAGAGCGGGFTNIDVKGTGMEALAETNADQDEVEKISKSNVPLAVEIVAPDVVAAAGRLGGRGKEYRETYPFGPVDADGNPLDIPEPPEERPTRVQMKIEGYADVVKEIGRNRFQERFSAVTVKFTDGKTMPEPSVVVIEPSVEVRWPARGIILGMSEVIVRLPGGESFSVKVNSEEHNIKGHMAWAFPVAILVIPISTAIMAGAMSSIKKDHYAECVVEALDKGMKRAAERLAEKLENQGAAVEAPVEPAAVAASAEAPAKAPGGGSD